MKRKPRKQDLAIIFLSALSVFACLYFPVPAWMLVFSVMILLVVIIGMIGNLGVFERKH